MSRAAALLDEAAAEPDRVRRHLLVAAALGEVMSPAPVVVGGTALELYTRIDRGATDLDLCAFIGDEERAGMRLLGFRRIGRHWAREGLNVGVEFPAPAPEGDRVVDIPVSGTTARLISAEDLYLDRLQQATAYDQPTKRAEYKEALAVAAAERGRLDWDYIRHRINAYILDYPMLTTLLPELHAAARSELGDDDPMVRGRVQS